MYKNKYYLYVHIYSNIVSKFIHFYYTDTSGWSANISNKELRQFSNEAGPILPHSFDVALASPLDYMYLMLDENIFHVLSEETNKYAEFLDIEAGKQNTKWSRTNVDEMKAYFGICMIMGINRRPEYLDYWSGDPMIGNAGFRNVMTLTR